MADATRLISEIRWYRPTYFGKNSRRGRAGPAACMNEVYVERRRQIQAPVFQPDQTNITARSVRNVNGVRFIVRRSIIDGYTGTNSRARLHLHGIRHVARQYPAAHTVGRDND